MFLTGCLPGSGRRESRELFPSDSLSRQIAEETPVEHLVLIEQTNGPVDTPMLLPHSIQVGPDGRFYIGDTRRDVLYVFNTQGAFVEIIAAAEFGYPYMAGSRGDSLAVMNRRTDELFFVSDGEVRRRMPLPGGEYVSALATDDRIYYKVTSEGADGYLAALSERGEPVDTLARLDGPYWRYIGFLREWDGRLMSLTGYRPVIDMLGTENRLDTLALVGFDSPMLARSRQFMLGRTSQLPLLTSAAAAVDSLLFVLNLRPGWVRVDIYDRRGRIYRVLEEENPSFNRHFYPLDLAVSRAEDGSYLIGIVGEHPVPRLSVYTWTPLEGAFSALTE